MSKSAVDVTEFEDAVRHTGMPCWNAVLPFTPEQRAKLDTVLFARPDITASAISRVLHQWGFERNEQVIRRHRSRACSCFQGTK